MMKIFVILAIFIVGSPFFQVQANRKPPWVGVSLDGVRCEGRIRGHGPYDYIKPGDRKELPIVEQYHFTPNVEFLRSGESGSLVQDLDYTLRAIPNHHRALLSVIRYQIRYLKKLEANKLVNPPECYLQRAINFNPKDAALHAIYGYYLSKINRLKEASKKYEEALKISPNNPKFEYSYSLILIKLKEYKKAMLYAKLAYEHGSPPNGLKNKLIKLGLWKKKN